MQASQPTSARAAHGVVRPADALVPVLYPYPRPPPAAAHAARQRTRASGAVGHGDDRCIAERAVYRYNVLG
jgi:hypothetical protein